MALAVVNDTNSYLEDEPMRQFVYWCGLLVTMLAGMSARADEKVYQKAAPSTVLIIAKGGAFGSGVLVDAGSRRVVTAAHVVKTEEAVTVVLPAFDREGRVITDLDHYLKRGGAVRGKVLDRRAACDLALIELDSLPLNVKGIRFSTGGAREGQVVHVIGHSNMNAGAVFGYSSGQVRNVFTRAAAPDHPLSGRLVLTSVATNQGDSGGPVLNDAGELVAIVSMGTTGKQAQQVVDYCIDVSEIRSLLDAHRPVKPYGTKPNLGVNPYEPSLSDRIMNEALRNSLGQSAPPRLFPPLRPADHR
jgi:S1-C subfamily serine protease